MWPIEKVLVGVQVLGVVALGVLSLWIPSYAVNFWICCGFLGVSLANFVD